MMPLFREHKIRKGDSHPEEGLPLFLLRGSRG